jgi:hypothetical protein
MEVRFEDIVLHPEEALTKVGAFIGENLDYEKISRARIGALRAPNTGFPRNGSLECFPRWVGGSGSFRTTRWLGWRGSLENFWWNLAIHYLALKVRHLASGYEPCERRIPPSID